MENFTDTENLVAVLKGLRDLQIEKRKLPEKLGEHEVLVSMRRVGICGSDVHYFAHGRCGHFQVDGPLVLGHESSGVIVSVGSRVKHLKPGDRVALEPGVPCRRCHSCVVGRYNLCPDVQFLATPPVDGSLSKYHIHDAAFAFKLPDNVSFEEGALAEPVSVGIHACNRAGVTAGSTVLVLGAGPIGLVSLLAARAAGATVIIVTDVREDRLEVALQLGATKAIHSAQLKQYIQDNNIDIDVTIECSGVESAIHTGMVLTRPGGKMCLIGRGPNPTINVPLYYAADREVDLIGVFRYANVYPKALALMASGQIDAKRIVTHHFKLQDVKTAFEVAESGAGGAIKVMFDIE